MENPKLEDLKDYDIIVAVIKKKPITEKKVKCNKCGGTNVHYKEGCLDCKKSITEKDLVKKVKEVKKTEIEKLIKKELKNKKVF